MMQTVNAALDKTVRQMPKRKQKRSPRNVLPEVSCAIEARTFHVKALLIDAQVKSTRVGTKLRSLEHRGQSKIRGWKDDTGHRKGYPACHG